jgi:hypothetical protein
MSKIPSTRWPEKVSEHAYDWLTPETVIRLALASYYRLCRATDHLPDDPTEGNFEHNNCRAQFSETLAQDLAWALEDHGHRQGVPGISERGSHMLALNYGPRSPDFLPPTLVRPRLAAGQGPDINRAL